MKFGNKWFHEKKETAKLQNFLMKKKNRIVLNYEHLDAAVPKLRKTFNDIKTDWRRKTDRAN